MVGEQVTPEGAVEEVEVLDDGIPCGEPGCPEIFRGERAAFERGGHLFRVHKIGGKKRKGAASEEDHRRRPVTAVLRDMAAEVDGKGKPSADALSRALGRGVGMTTMAVASYYVETDETIPHTPEGERQRDNLVDELSLTPRAAEELMSPIGRALAPTKLNERYGRTLVENIDVVGAIDELALLVLRWRRAFRERRYREQVMGLRPIDVEPVSVSTPSSPPPAGPPPPPMAQPASPATAPPSGDQPHTTPAPTMGTVVTPAMVEDMRRRRAGNG
jgi:hypothetical protein